MGLRTSDVSGIFIKSDKKGGGSRITVYQANNDYSESYYIAKEIRRLIREDGYSNKDIAILYRANSQSRVIEDRLAPKTISNIEEIKARGGKIIAVADYEPEIDGVSDLIKIPACSRPRER